jgi:hypothetical protein
MTYDVKPPAAKGTGYGLGAFGTDGRIRHERKRAVLMDARPRDCLATWVLSDEVSSVRAGEALHAGILAAEQSLRIRTDLLRFYGHFPELCCACSQMGP